MKCLFTISLFFVFLSPALAQKSDTLSISDSLSDHSPAKATIMSMVLPGLGQAYNKKYWKVPLAWAIIATPLYFALDQQKQFKGFKEAYAKRADDNPATIDTKYTGVYSDENVLSLIDFHRKNRDLLFVFSIVGYTINVLDAAVDAHLFYFDVSDELSANIKPTFQYSTSQQMFVPSLTLSLKFAKKPHRNAY